MNTEALFLFLILLLGLVLCSFLGGNCGTEGFEQASTANIQVNKQPQINGNGWWINSGNGGGGWWVVPVPIPGDNYNHMQQTMSSLQNDATYIGPNGGVAVVKTNSDGTQSLHVTMPDGKIIILNPRIKNRTDTLETKNTSIESTNYYGANGTATIFYGPNGETATIVKDNNGQYIIKIQTSEGIYMYGSNNGYNNGTTNTQYYGSTGYNLQNYSGSATGGNNPYYNQNSYYGGSATGPYGNSAYYAEGPNGNAVAGTTSNTNPYYTDEGISISDIPPGQEDLYILKSQVVPPVCPVCPSVAAANASLTKEKCPPCPACARCPESSFECKKVPNYNAINNDELPVAVLNDFSTFGM